MNSANASLTTEDCLDFLKKIPDNSIDLVCADPPYFRIIKDDWDNQWKTEQEYLDWCKEWTKECFRVLKPNKCFYIWGTTKYDTFLRYKLDILNNIPGAFYQNWIIWHYDWGGRTKTNFARKHEDLLMYSKGKEFDFYADSILVPRMVKTNMMITRKINLLKKYLNPDWPSLEKITKKDQQFWRKHFMSLDKTRDVYTNKKTDAELILQLEKEKKKDLAFAKGKIPTDVWKKNNHTTSKEYAGWHPTQKPLEIMDRIIKANTEPGDTVLDCFAGSGSTMISALRTGRKFLGCDFLEEYVTKSLERAEELLNGAEK
jgi:DNA modification methylase